MISVDSTTSQPHSTDADKPIKSTCVGCWLSNQSRTRGNTSCQKEARGRLNKSLFLSEKSSWHVEAGAHEVTLLTCPTWSYIEREREYSIIEQVSLSRPCLLHVESASLRDRERTLFGKLPQGREFNLFLITKQQKKKEEKNILFSLPS